MKFKRVLITFAILILTLSIIYFIPERRKEIKTQHFIFLFSSSIDTTPIIDLANALESNYARIGEDLKIQPTGNIETNNNNALLAQSTVRQAKFNLTSK